MGARSLDDLTDDELRAGLRRLLQELHIELRCVTVPVVVTPLGDEGTAPGYELGGTGAQRWIRCLMCQGTSYHPEDVRRLYCGRCRLFHTAPA